jgi:soluble lytic murein transglycosylase-like protein
MTPRSSPARYAQTAAPEQGSGCLSGFLLPPLVVVIVGILLAAFARGLPLPAETGFPVVQAAPLDATDPKNAAAPTALIVPVEIPSGGTSAIAALFTPEIQYWGGKITLWAAQAGLDPNLVATVMQIESCGDPQARSRAGATGLFQVMPYHFIAGENAYDPDTNALRGTGYLSRSLTTANGNARLAFAGYNGGIGVIGRLESSWAAETQRYAYWGSGIYADASQGSASSGRLDEWLQAGGASLCRQAKTRLGLP